MLEGYLAPFLRRDVLTDPCLVTCSSPYPVADRPVHRASVRIYLQEMMTTHVHPTTSNKAYKKLLLTTARDLRWVFIGTQRHIHWVVFRGITGEHPRSTFWLLCCPKFAKFIFLNSHLSKFTNGVHYTTTYCSDRSAGDKISLKIHTMVRKDRHFLLY